MITHQQRIQGRRPRKTYAGKPRHSRYKGVTYRKGGRGTKRWLAQLKTPDGRFLKKSFVFEIDAARQYDAWALEHFREHAFTNAMAGLL